MTQTVSMQLKAEAPFNFDLTAQLFHGADPQIRCYADKRFHQVIRVNGNLVLARVEDIGSLEAPELKAVLQSNQPLTASDTEKAKETLSYIFNLKFSLSEFYQEIESDQTMRSITQKLYGLKLPTYPTVYESLVDSIVEQQISIKVAHKIEEKLARRFGEKLVVDGSTFFVFPRPADLASAGLDDIRGCGLSLRKAEYIQQASQLIVNGKLDLEHMKLHKSPEEIVAELDRIRGIGVWTAELIMLEGMQRMDALPADDFGIRRVISRYYCDGAPIKSVQAREIAKAWGTWKGLASWYLIVAEAQGIVV